MSAHDVRILFVGDMHLGTQSSRVPPELGDAAAFGPAAAWRRAVDAALDHRVHAVALAGDVVNRQNELFEARRPLDEGLARLAGGGVRVFAVAGNHDTATLPTLARRDDRLRLVGAGGAWERVELAAGVDLVGWSFPRAQWPDSPFATSPPPPRDGAVTLGLLHCDLGATESAYAPVAAREFAGAGYGGWFLGHVHTPGAPVTDGRPFYLGSLTPLDPSETGVHGPVLVTVRADGGLAAERLPLAPLRWEHWTIPCDELSAMDDLPNLLMAGIDERVAGLAAGPGPERCLGLRIVLVGAVASPLAVADATARLDIGTLRTAFDGGTVFVDRVECAVHGRVDVAALAHGRDPVGLLARRILALDPQTDADPALRDAILERARAAAGGVDALPACRSLDEPLNLDALRGVALQAARRLLDRMLSSTGGRP